MALGYLPLLLVHLAGASWTDAETVNVGGRGAVDLKPFVCQDITRSSLVNRVCYDAANRTMIVQLNSVYSQYCHAGGSAGQLPERAFNGAILQRQHQGLGGAGAVPMPSAGILMGKFFLVIVAISIALVLGTAVVVTYF
jgi:hypothetical protein